jgi:hypothetical protein
MAQPATSQRSDEEGGGKPRYRYDKEGVSKVCVQFFEHKVCTKKTPFGIISFLK